MCTNMLFTLLGYRFQSLPSSLSRLRSWVTLAVSSYTYHLPCHRITTCKLILRLQLFFQGWNIRLIQSLGLHLNSGVTIIILIRINLSFLKVNTNLSLVEFDSFYSAKSLYSTIKSTSLNWIKTCEFCSTYLLLHEYLLILYKLLSET